MGHKRIVSYKLGRKSVFLSQLRIDPLFVKSVIIGKHPRDLLAYWNELVVQHELLWLNSDFI